MPGFQPRITTDHVWYNGTDIHTYALATGLGIRLTEIRGWDERPDVRDVREVRFQQHGEYTDNVFLGGRTITIQGVVHGSSWVNLQARKRELAALFQPVSDEVLLKIPDPATAAPTGTYAVTGMTGYERASVRPIEGIAFGDMIGSCAMTFQVILRASDPRVYSDVETSGDSGTTGTSARTVVVDQGGTYETPTTLTVTGPTASTFTVQEPGSGLLLSMSGLTVQSGETVTFDVLDRTITYTSTYEGVRLLRDSLLALWMLDESAGTTADNEEGTSAYDGTYTGGYTLNQSGPVSGIASVDLNGSTGYVAIPHSNNLFPASPFTFEAWVNFDSIAASKCLIDGITSNKGWRLEWNGSAFVMTWGTGTTTGSTTLSAGTISTGTWYHIVVQWNQGSSNVKLYVNGVQTFSGFPAIAATSYSPSTTGGYRLGNRLDGSNDFDGKMAAVGLYNAIVSATDLFAETADSSDTSGYTYLDAASSEWANLGTASSTFTLSSSGLNTGSKLNVAHRDARL